MLCGPDATIDGALALGDKLWGLEVGTSERTHVICRLNVVFTGRLLHIWSLRLDTLEYVSSSIATPNHLATADFVLHCITKDCANRVDPQVRLALVVAGPPLLLLLGCHVSLGLLLAIWYLLVRIPTSDSVVVHLGLICALILIDSHAGRVCVWVQHSPTAVGLVFAFLLLFQLRLHLAMLFFFCLHTHQRAATILLAVLHLTLILLYREDDFTLAHITCSDLANSQVT